jgi:hypothetical protein
MRNVTRHRRNEPRSQPVPVATALQRSRSHGRGRVRRSRSRPQRWVLVRVWDGAVLAAFDDEASARTVMSCADDDEVVVLCVDT